MSKAVRTLLVVSIMLIFTTWHATAKAGYLSPIAPPTTTPVVVQVVVEPISGTLPLQLGIETSSGSTSRDFIEPLMAGLLAIIGTAVGAFLGAYYERRGQDQRWGRERRQKRYQGLEGLLVEIGKIAHHARFISLELPRAHQLDELGEQIVELQTLVRGLEFSDAYARATDIQLIASLDEIELAILALPAAPTSLDETRQALQVLASHLNTARRRLETVIVSGDSGSNLGEKKG